MRVGIACAVFPGAEGDPVDRTLELACEDGFEVIQLLTPHAVSPSLAPAAMRAVRRRADELGIGLELGISPLAIEDDRLGPAVLERLSACIEAGCREISAFTLLDRLDPTTSMAAQLEGLARACEALAPWLRDRDVHLNVETHEDVTSHEIARLVERVGDDVLGVTLDVANLVVRAEDPVAATRRVAPYVRQTHLEDVGLHFVPAGIRRTTLPCGTGVIDWPQIISALAERAADGGPALCLEQHRGQFDADIFDPAWREAHPDLDPGELAGLVGTTVRCIDGTGGPIVDRSDWPPVPTDPVARRAALAASAAHLRSVLAAS